MTLPRRLGKYRLVRRLAVGGVAEVYLAVAEGLSGFEKRVVLKRLIPELGRDTELLSMFLDEARLMALLHHPHIAEVYDIGAEDGEYFFALEHVAGCDLRDLLQARAGEPLPLEAALTLVVAVADGLEHAHEQRGADGQLLGVVHRDVTPSNVLCGLSGEIKLVDFGVAKWTAQRSRTEQGTIKGKLAYMSPEQCRAEPLDRRSDVFALGVILYELTTGARPFVGESEFEILSAIVAGRTEPPSRRRTDYPPALEALVMKALSTDRAQRFATAGQMRDALAGIAAEMALPLGPSHLIELVRAAVLRREEAEPAAIRGEAKPSPERTATDMAMVETATPPARGLFGRRTTTLVGAALLLASAFSVAMALRDRPAKVAAPVSALQSQQSQQSQPSRSDRQGAAEQPRPEPGELANRAAPASSAARLLPVSHPPPVVAPAKSPSSIRPVAKRRARGRPQAKEAMKVWDPDSATPP